MYRGKEDNQNGIAIRLYMWKAVSGLIKERPLIGYGIKGGRLETLAKYKRDGFEMGVQGDYHAHNQYLESWLMAGIPGVILLLSMMFSAFWKGIKSKNFLLLLMVVHFMAQCVFESTFEVQHELVFYIFLFFSFITMAHASVTLCFDFGNTRLKCGVFDGPEIREVLTLENDKEETIARLIEKYKPAKSLLSSVINHNPGIETMLSGAGKFHRARSSFKGLCYHTCWKTRNHRSR